MEGGKIGRAPVDNEIFLLARKLKKLPHEIRDYKKEHPRDYAWMWAYEVAVSAAQKELERREARQP